MYIKLSQFLTILYFQTIYDTYKEGSEVEEVEGPKTKEETEVPMEKQKAQQLFDR